MKKDVFARELMLEELRKEQGGFVTLRIIDRLVLLYSPLFDRELLTTVADRINTEERERRQPVNADPERSLLDTLKLGAAARRFAAA